MSGNNPNVYDIRSLKLDQGRFYNMEDQVQRGRVAVHRVGGQGEAVLRDAMRWASTFASMASASKWSAC